jgi:ribulose-5-phosphate 4-epimerase/fuculose-1-phosphate aldolase
MDALRTELEELVSIAHSMFQRGYSFGTAGNISIRRGAHVYATPTGSSFGTLRADGLAACDLDGKPLNAQRPTKELPFHLAAYRARPGAGAVVHLHSTYATALASIRNLDEANALPPITAYFAMRVPVLPCVPYHPPGDNQLAVEVERLARQTPALLMRNHGSIAIGKTLVEAAALAEEVEETARLYFLLGERVQPLTAEQTAELRARFT